MLYISTRGCAEKITASEAILRGIAEDGGLYVPEEFPKIGFELDEMRGFDYQRLAFELLRLFLTDFTDDEIRYCVSSAYDEKFDIPEIVGLKEAGGAYFLELYHGRTLAFKDMALSILPYFMQIAAKKRGETRDILILAATSGDTGKAALEGFAGVPGFKIAVFYPIGGVSEVQRLQMTTQEGENTAVIGVFGNFDDAQTGVKRLFADADFIREAEEGGYTLSSANSINIGRLLPQIVYYFESYRRLLELGKIKAGDEITFTVPTGNFGNILAGYYAKKIGLPIKALICASNENRVLTDFLDDSVYDRNRDFVLTASPSMDILVSSNLERLIYDLSRDGAEVREKMAELEAVGKYAFDAGDSGIKGYSASEGEAFAAIAYFAGKGYVFDTHTAVAAAAYAKYKADFPGDEPNVCLSTASAYKFADSVIRAITGEEPGDNIDELLGELSRLSNTELPSQIAGLARREVLHRETCAKDEMKEAVRKCVINKP